MGTNKREQAQERLATAREIYREMDMTGDFAQGLV
jgi:hypothetical protein